MVIGLWLACSGDDDKPPPSPEGDADTDVDTDTDCPTDLDAGDAVPFVVAGNTAGAGAAAVGSCGGAGEDTTVAFRAPAAGQYLFDTHGSRLDTVVYAVDACGGAELGCDDDAGIDGASHLVVTLSAGQPVVLWVDAAGGGGPFVLTGTAVDPTETRCDDRYDDDADQLIDCADPDCTACVEVCPALVADGFPTSVAGATTGAPDQLTPSCAAGPSSDVAVSFVAPSAGRYGFAVAGAPFDSALVLLDACGGAELGCADVDGLGGEALAVFLEAGQEVVAAVDGYQGDHGPFTLAVFTPSDAELDCGDGIDEDVDGLADCADPDCAGGCFEDCGDGVDDDADQQVDCADPDCDADPRCAEDCGDGVDQDFDGLTDCADPGCDLDPGCAEDCENNVDDDGDGFIDCADGGCAETEVCGGDCPDLGVGEGTVAGDTTAAGDELSPSCGGPGAPEVTVAFTPDETGTYVFDTVGSAFDTVLAVLSDCGAAELGCSDDGPGWLGPSLVAVPLTGGDTVIAVVDGLDGAAGAYTLTVTRAPDDELDCGDGLDEDFDGSADCADAGCAPGCDCPEHTLTAASVSGTTSGSDDLAGSCGYGASPEETWAYTAGASGDVTFSTAGSAFDTVLYVLDACGGAELACSDDGGGGSTSELVVPMTAGQTVIVVVDGYGGAAGDYTLSVD